MNLAERQEYQRLSREALAEDGITIDEPTCRLCGCSDSLACLEGCWWVEPDLCSECAADLEDAVTSTASTRRDQPQGSRDSEHPAGHHTPDTHPPPSPAS